jgi:hypothetical protein
MTNVQEANAYKKKRLLINGITVTVAEYIGLDTLHFIKEQEKGQAFLLCSAL